MSAPSAISPSPSTIDPGQLLMQPDAIQDPYPVYDYLRPIAPVQWSEAAGAWMVFTHREAREVFRDHEHFSNGDSKTHAWDSLPPEVQAELPVTRFVETTPALSSADGELHLKHRRAVSRPLAPRRLEALRDWVDGLCQSQLDVLAAADKPDLLRDYAEPLAFQVILGLFGVPTSFAASFSEAGMTRSRFISWGNTSPETAYEYEESLVALRAALEGIMSDTPPGDETLVAQMVALRERHEFTRDEVFQILKIFFTAGHENLVYALPMTIWFLLRDPEQLELAMADPKNAAGAYEEAIRMEPHNQGNARRAAVDRELGGTLIRQGDRVMDLKAAANRDPAVWSDPNTFDLRRDQNAPEGGSITFGQGVHFCVGAGVARLAGPLAVQRLLDRFPNLAAEAGWTPRFQPIVGTRKLVDFPVVLNTGGVSSTGSGDHDA